VTRCDRVTPRESVESRSIVTVLVTRLPHRGEQELDGHSLALADRAMDPRPLVVAGHGTVDHTGFESPTGLATLCSGLPIRGEVHRRAA
jgi:hypothetical protein